MTKFDPLNPRVEEYKHNSRTSVMLREVSPFRRYAVWIEDSGKAREGFYAGCDSLKEAKILFNAWCSNVKAEDLVH